MNTKPNKTRTIIGWVLTTLISLQFLASVIFKLIGHEEVLKEVAPMGLDEQSAFWIGILELICLILFIIPRTGVLGTVLLIAYIGGTIMAHLTVHEPFIMNIVIGVVIGVTGYLRFPELGQRLFFGKA